MATSARSVLLAGIVIVLTSAGCSAAPKAEAPPGVALGVTGLSVERPIEAAEMQPGKPYRFTDLLPGVLDVDLAASQPGVFSFPSTGTAYLAADADATRDVATLTAADDVALLRDPYGARTPGAVPDPGRDLMLPTAGQLLDRLAGQPFLQTTAPARNVTIAGMTARAVDVRVPELPPQAIACGPSAPPCAVLAVASSGFGQSVVGGQQLRLAELELPTGRVLVIQNLGEPRAQTVLDGARFVEHAVPPALAPARSLPYTQLPLQPDQTYGAVLTAVGVGVTFTTGSTPTVGYTKEGKNLAVISADEPADIIAPSVQPYTASTEQIFGYVAATTDLLVPDPGVDPRVIGTTAFARSKGTADAGSGGIVDLIAAQPWADVVAPPAASTVAGLPGRSVDVRLRIGAGTVPCTLATPAAGSCAVLLYSRTSHSLWLLSDRVLRVSEVTVGRRSVTIVTSIDTPGRTLLASLRMTELPA